MTEHKGLGTVEGGVVVGLVVETLDAHDHHRYDDDKHKGGNHHSYDGRQPFFGWYVCGYVRF